MAVKRLGEPFVLHPCPFTPHAFQSRLEDVFGDALRLRWSLRKGAWLIEQKVGRGATKPIRIAEWDDSLIQARDGYAQVMAIQPGTSMGCPYCGRSVAVPRLETAEARCEPCLRRNIDARYMTSYYPLGEVLIEHLRMITRPDLPERIKREDERARRLKRQAEEAGHREAAAQLKDGLIDQLPKAGFPSLVPDGWRH